MKKEIAILYHAECPDGFSAAYAAWRKFGSKAIYIPVYHQTMPPEEIYGKDVYTLDYSYPLEVVKKLLPNIKSLTIIDHHITNWEQIKLVGGVYDIDHSGAVLSWKYFHPGKPLPRFFKNVEDIDLWRFKVPYTEEISEIDNLVPMEFKSWGKLVKRLETKAGLKKCIEEGKILIRKRDDQVRKIARYAEEIIFEGHKVLLVNSPVHVSHLGNFLARTKPPFAIVWSRRGDKIIVNLRSVGTFNVEEIARKYGGGGHRNAAGFSWEEKDFLKFKKA